MTTVVICGDEIAADGLVTRGNMIETNKHVKIRRFNGFWAGFCGSLHDSVIMAEHLNNPEHPLPDDLNCEALLMHDNGKNETMTMMNGFLIAEKVSGNTAIGSGGGYAKAALSVGADAKEAVKAACSLDVFSGGKITCKKRGSKK